MLGTLTLVQHVFGVALMLLALHSFWRPALPPPVNRIGRLYRRQPRLLPLGNALLVILGLVSAGRLAIHFALIDAGWSEWLDWAGLLFLTLSILMLVLLARAWRATARSPG